MTNTERLQGFRTLPWEGIVEILDEYAVEMAQPLLDALERIKRAGTTDIGTPTTWEGKIARDAISAWNERK